MEIDLKALGRESTHTETKDFRKFTDSMKDCGQIITLKYLLMLVGQNVVEGHKLKFIANKSLVVISDIRSEVMLVNRSAVWIPA